MDEGVVGDTQGRDGRELVEEAIGGVDHDGLGRLGGWARGERLEDGSWGGRVWVFGGGSAGEELDGCGGDEEGASALIFRVWLAAEREADVR